MLSNAKPGGTIPKEDLMEVIMADTTSTPQHCPGYQSFKTLKSFTCKCPKCGEVKEIFSDEFDRPHTCSKCDEPIDFSQCQLEGEGKSISPR
ncbi:MAG: hypothetical protein PVF26_15475 [Desulfobacterales bacterium]